MGVRQGESRDEANLHAAVLALTAPVSDPVVTAVMRLFRPPAQARDGIARSEEHTSELQSHSDLVCRPLLEKKRSTPSAMTRHTRCAATPRPFSTSSAPTR